MLLYIVVVSHEIKRTVHDWIQSNATPVSHSTTFKTTAKRNIVRYVMRMQLCLICICTAPESRRMGKLGVKQTLENTQAERRFVVNLPTRNKNVRLEKANRSVQRGENSGESQAERTEHVNETFKNKSAYDHKEFNKVKKCGRNRLCFR
jgi:flavin reductase (DIM6/NTAB) family NADH-FMN oxidoreductase RutF